MTAKQDRTEYGFTATVCACALCTRQCEHISGMLNPGDLPRWREHFGARENIDLARLLLASPGALVKAHGGEPFRIQTIVPNRTATGACVFLDSNKRCTIHSLAPFGCRFFDEHMPPAESNARSVTALMEVLQDWNAAGPYSQLWLALYAQGRVAEGPELIRQRMQR